MVQLAHKKVFKGLYLFCNRNVSIFGTLFHSFLRKTNYVMVNVSTFVDSLCNSVRTDTKTEIYPVWQNLFSFFLYTTIPIKWGWYRIYLYKIELPFKLNSLVVYHRHIFYLYFWCYIGLICRFIRVQILYNSEPI